MAPQVKKYITEGKEFLAIDDSRDLIRIAWFGMEEEDFGLYVGEKVPEVQSPTPPTNKSDWETWVAHNTLAPFAKEDRGHNEEYLFRSMAIAKQAIKAGNEALHRGIGVPWPDWALKAQAAGWTPPTGWKP